MKLRRLVANLLLSSSYLLATTAPLNTAFAVNLDEEDQQEKSEWLAQQKFDQVDIGGTRIKGSRFADGSIWMDEAALLLMTLAELDSRYQIFPPGQDTPQDSEGKMAKAQLEAKLKAIKDARRADINKMKKDAIFMAELRHRLGIKVDSFLENLASINVILACDKADNPEEAKNFTMDKLKKEDNLYKLISGEKIGLLYGAAIIETTDGALVIVPGLMGMTTEKNATWSYSEKVIVKTPTGSNSCPF